MNTKLDRIEPYVRWTLLFIGFFAALFLGGCVATNPLISQDSTSTAYQSAQVPQQVKLGQVISVREVQILNRPAHLAQYTGGSLGAVFGHAVSKKITSNQSARLLLSGLSGAMGAAVGKQMASTVPGQEVVIKLDDSRVVAISQSSADGVRFRTGERVMVIGQGRVAHLNF